MQVSASRIQRRIADAETIATRLDLMLGLFARRVEHGADRLREVRGGLQQQRRLADARLAAEEHERSGHDAAAEHAIEFADAGRRCDRPSTLQSPRTASRRASAIPASRSDAPCGAAPAAFERSLFDERVPRAAIGARPCHFGACDAALLADEDRSWLVSLIVDGRSHRDTETQRNSFAHGAIRASTDCLIDPQSHAIVPQCRSVPLCSEASS